MSYGTWFGSRTRRTKRVDRDQPMQRYDNWGGDSNVHSFAIADDSITVRFHPSDFYLYDYDSAGRENIERMKVLALGGQGLNSFIMRNVKTRYAAKDCRMKYRD